MNPSEGPSSPANASKARLTDEQKKRNHIESEKKRREAIRNGFDRLSTIVPGMQGQARSEAIVLAATVDHMRAMIKQKEQIHAAAMAKGWTPEQFNRYYQLAEQEARAMENVPLQLNSAGVPVPMQSQQQIQMQGSQQALGSSAALTTPPSGTPSTSAGPAAFSSVAGNDESGAVQQGGGESKSRSESP